MYVSIDIGATLSRVAVSTDLKNIAKTEVFSSLPNVAQEAFEIESAIKSLIGNESVEAIAIGIAGVINKRDKIVEKSPNYSQLNGTHIKTLLGKFGTCDVIYCANDAELAGLGEAVLGAGGEHDFVAYLSIGTGVGAILIEGKKLGDTPKSYEAGHQIINFDAKVFDRYNLHGSLEAYISGTGFKNIYKQDPQTCDDEKIWFEYGKVLGVGLLNVIMMQNPQVIVIGGGISEKFDKFEGGILKTIKSATFIAAPSVKKSAFGQGSGLVGGFVLISQEIG